MASRTASKDIITLRGSAAIVSEFFGYAANSILYNRGVYPEESFTKVKKYGLTMLLTQDEGVKTFIANLNTQLSEWLEAGKLQRIVLVIMSKATSEVLERWNFSIQTDPEVVDKGVIKEKSDKEIMREIQAIMRQVASCITYLPCLDEPCIFDVLAYTDMDVAVPFTWVESDAKLIENPQMVKLHSFDTKVNITESTPFLFFRCLSQIADVTAPCSCHGRFTRWTRSSPTRSTSGTRSRSRRWRLEP
jgi:mitotic spindle assembly checkpoint protein MAD2